jgi:hypothetical protein
VGADPEETQCVRFVSPFRPSRSDFAIGSTSVASAAPEPVAGCSKGYELMTVKTVLRTIAASGFEESIKAFDVNADGYLCIKIIPNEGGPPQFDPAFLYLDNKI